MTMSRLEHTQVPHRGVCSACVYADSHMADDWAPTEPIGSAQASAGAPGGGYRGNTTAPTEDASGGDAGRSM